MSIPMMSNQIPRPEVMALNKAAYLRDKKAASNQVIIAENNVASATQCLKKNTRNVKECENGVKKAEDALARKISGSKSTKSILECEEGVKKAKEALERAKEFVKSAEEVLETAKETVKKAEEAAAHKYNLREMYRIDLISDTKPMYTGFFFNNSSKAEEASKKIPNSEVLDKSYYEYEWSNYENNRQVGESRYEIWIILRTETIMVDTDSHIGEGDIIITDFTSLSKKTTVKYKGSSYTIVSKIPVKFYGDKMVEDGNEIYLV